VPRRLWHLPTTRWAGSSFYSLTGTIQANNPVLPEQLQPARDHFLPAASAFRVAGDFTRAPAARPTNNYGNDYFGTAQTAPNWERIPTPSNGSLSVGSSIFSASQDYRPGPYLLYIGSPGTHQLGLVVAPMENNAALLLYRVRANNQPVFGARRFPNWGVVNTPLHGS